MSFPGSSPFYQPSLFEPPAPQSSALPMSLTQIKRGIDDALSFIDSQAYDDARGALEDLRRLCSRG